MAKSRNNLLGVGGQRKKLSRAGAQGAGPAGEAADRRSAADQKQELLRKMRERAAGTEQPDAADAEAEAQAPEAPAQS
ncbi:MULTISPECIES: DUF6243 family protein [unclassified Streptomyces]|uniref:DUF6243 family protein n=1 Tax=unclassified Streptomyces TaxID=2593676 RepID=UPI0003818C7B|nr:MULTISPECIES: DUF6243 family protein [unclassified Streptomyces]MYQ79172.1 hypothetical protein [Streptomyces sp. SID4923]